MKTSMIVIKQNSVSLLLRIEGERKVQQEALLSYLYNLWLVSQLSNYELQFNMKLRPNIIISILTVKQRKHLMNSNQQPNYFPYTVYSTPIFNPYLNMMMFSITEQNAQYWTILNNQWPQQPIIVEADLHSKESCPRTTKTFVFETTGKENPELMPKNRQVKENISIEKKKSPGAQKEDRNVASNLLRIFFKNILEVTFYQGLIVTLLQKYKIEATPEEFYQWLEKFKINYKNYIKPGEMVRILSARHCQPFQKIFRILLRNFMNDVGISHCLTSKRIEQSCTLRHLQGLRKLCQSSSS